MFDNPEWSRSADPGILGLHRQGRPRFLKVIETVAPDESSVSWSQGDGPPPGDRVLATTPSLRAGRAREPDGSLQLWAGSIAFTAWSGRSSERSGRRGLKLPSNRAIKKSLTQLRTASRASLHGPNVPVKFEPVHLDPLCRMAERSSIVETDRSSSSSRSRTHRPDSRPTVRQRMSEPFARLARGPPGEGTASLAARSRWHRDQHPRSTHWTAPS